MSSRSSLTLSLSTGLALLIVVACSPSRDQVRITQGTATKTQKAVNSCRDSLRSSLAVDVSALKKSVLVCRQTLSADRTKTSHFHLVEQPVAYRISKSNASDEATVISIKIGLRTAKALSEKAQAAFTKIFEDHCVSATQQIYARSKIAGAAPFRLESQALFSKNDAFVDSTKFDDSTTAGSASGTAQLNEPKSADQNLYLTKYQDSSDEFFTIDGSLSHARFYASGRRSEFAACQSAYKKNRQASETRGLCKAAHAAWRKSNAPFCMEVAQLIGAWTGVVSPAVEASKCADIKSAAVSAVKPVETAGVSFTGANPSMAEEFFAKAKLSETDLVQILMPACPGLEAGLKELPK